MEDSSIYRDLYAVWGQAQVWWAVALPILKSEIAMRYYTGFTGLAALGLSVRKASQAQTKLIDLLKKEKHDPFLGRPPSKQDSILLRIGKIANRTVGTARAFSRNFITLLIFGILVPSLIFLIFLLNYNWFDPLGIAFVAIANGEAVHQATLPQLAKFVTDQITHSLMLDIPEVFALDTATLSNNPSNTIFSSLVLAFRLTVAGSAIFLFRSMRDSFPVLLQLYRQDKEDIEKMQAKLPA